MDEEKLPDLIKQAIIDRLEGWELVDFLQIDTETIVEMFEDVIVENMEDVLDFIGIRNDDDGDE